MQQVAFVIPTYNEAGSIGLVIDRIPVSDLQAEGFEIEADMFAECTLKGFSMTELPINYYKRSDRAKLSSIKDGLKIGIFLFQKRFILAKGQNTPAKTENQKT